jgi:N-carbamoylputrescine amidase
MDKDIEVISSVGKLFDSPSRKKPKERGSLRLCVIQDNWHESLEKQKDSLRQLSDVAQKEKPQLILFQELTLNPYACSIPRKNNPEWLPEDLTTGETFNFAKEIANLTNAFVVMSLYEKIENNIEKGYNTAIVVSPSGKLVSKTRKTHLPVTAGYYEDTYFLNGEDKTPIFEIDGAKVGTPTCWDQWFPELARLYGLKKTDLICYPTAIGSEPDHPNFDTKDLWQKMMVAHGIANGMFVAASNRIGEENGITFYGSSFISDPYCRLLVQASRDKRIVLVADLDLDQKRDWLELFPFFETRQPQMYEEIVKKDY